MQQTPYPEAQVPADVPDLEVHSDLDKNDKSKGENVLFCLFHTFHKYFIFYIRHKYNLYMPATDTIY